MEIERKFTVRSIPGVISHNIRTISLSRVYLNTNPVVRVRREDDTCYLTYKGKGLMAREEYNLPPE